MEMLKAHEPVAIALSGGTDSMVLLAFAVHHGVKVSAVSADTGINPAGELIRAAEIAGSLGIPHKILPIDVLRIPEVRNNSKTRCYLCKKAMMGELQKQALESGFLHLADGTHADDDPAGRPGMKALTELGIISPFAECGIGKDMIKTLAEEFGVPLISPSSCLATRFPEDENLTREKLEKIRSAEELLGKYITGRLRVRYLNNTAIVETLQNEYITAQKYADQLMAFGFEKVEISVREK